MPCPQSTTALAPQISTEAAIVVVAQEVISSRLQLLSPWCPTARVHHGVMTLFYHMKIYWSPWQNNDMYVFLAFVLTLKKKSDIHSDIFSDTHSSSFSFLHIFWHAGIDSATCSGQIHDIYSDVLPEHTDKIYGFPHLTGEKTPQTVSAFAKLR